MNFDEIIGTLDTWMGNFDKFFGWIYTPIGDLLVDIEWLQFILPDALKNATIFGLMFGTTFFLFIMITMIKWIKDLIL